MGYDDKHGISCSHHRRISDRGGGAHDRGAPTGLGEPVLVSYRKGTDTRILGKGWGRKVESGISGAAIDLSEGAEKGGGGVPPLPLDPPMAVTHVTILSHNFFLDSP